MLHQQTGSQPKSGAFLQEWLRFIDIPQHRYTLSGVVPHIKGSHAANLAVSLGLTMT